LVTKEAPINGKWHMASRQDVTLEGQIRDPDTLIAQYLENS